MTEEPENSETNPSVTLMLTLYFTHFLVVIHTQYMKSKTDYWKRKLRSTSPICKR